jgi:hypothetical protein
MLHHTGTPSTAAGDYPTLKVVRDGRPGLENSLAMYGIGRSGTIYCINEKISWHAGVGDWNGVTDGNGYFAGIEAEGPYSTWPAAEVDAYERLVASILIETGRGLAWAPTHAQWANPSGRKTDPLGMDLTKFRVNVQRYLNNPALLGGQVPTPTPISEEGDEDTMYIRNSRGMIVHLTPMWARAIDPTTWKGVQAAGLKAVQYSDADFDEMIAAANGVDVALRHLDKMIGDHVLRIQKSLETPAEPEV